MKDLTLIEFYKQFPNEQACIDYLIELRWGKTPICTNCGSVRAYVCKTRPICKCYDCKAQFSVKIGTIFEESRLPLQKWFLAVYLLTSLKKGVSSVTLSKYLGITQKSAWFMLQRIRHAMKQGSFDKPLEGIVEIDETYISGVHSKEFKNDKKEIIFGAVERGGRTKLKHVKSSGVRVLVPEITNSISPDATIYSDTWGAYRNLTKIGYTHESVNHGKLEYARGSIHTNTIEGGVWDHLKLGLKAIYMGVSPKHLEKYCDEFSFRYNSRGLKDGERFQSWFKDISGKRLTYEKLIG